MKKIILFALCAMIMLSVSGCVVAGFSNVNAVSGRGNLEKYEFRVGDYTGIRIEGFCNINYHAAPSNTVTLEVQPNLREYFVVEVVGGDLVVRTTRRVNVSSGRTPVLTVSTPTLNRLSIEGAGTFTAHDKITADSFDLSLLGAVSGKAELDVRNFYIDMSGAGRFELSGVADTADIRTAGAGELNALSLQTRTATINFSGVGSAKISCSENLSIDANGTGSVEYRGSPHINLRQSGFVSIKQVN